MSQKLEILAPDYAISANTTGYLTSAGTSAAAPLAAGAFALLRNAFPNASSEQILSAMKSTGTKVDDVLRKGIPMVNLAAAYNQLASGTTVNNPAQPSNSDQKVTIGTFNGFIAIYTQGYEGRRMTARVAGRWLAVDPITLAPGKPYSLTKRNTGAGFTINVEVYIDGELVKTQQVLTR
jgi:subtilisin family serine protease